MTHRTIKSFEDLPSSVAKGAYPVTLGDQPCYLSVAQFNVFEENQGLMFRNETAHPSDYMDLVPFGINFNKIWRKHATFKYQRITCRLDDFNLACIPCLL